MKAILGRLLGSLVLFGTAALAAATVPPAPPTLAGGTVDVVQGITIADPYRWLENWADPKVVAWSDSQNARARGYLDALPGRKKAKSVLTGLITASSPSYSHLAARGAHVFASYSDPKFQQPMLVTLDASADPASRKPVLDPNLLDAKGLTAIDWFVPSDDGSKVAVSLSKNGSEDGTLHIYDVATAKEIDTPIPRVQYPTAGGSLAWAADGKGFWYTRYPGGDAPEADRHFNMQVYFHRLASNPRNDALALGARDGLERVSEVFLDNRFNRPSIVAMVQRGDGNIWTFYVLREGDRPVQIAAYEDHIVFAIVGPDDGVYAISRDHASNGKILKLKPPFAKQGLAKAAVIVPESDVAILAGGAESGERDLNFSGTRMFVRDIVGGPNQVRVFDLDGKPTGRLPLGDIAGNSEIEALANGDVLFDITTYLRPRYYAVWHAATGQVEETPLKVTSPVSFSDAEVVREFATSKDGTKVPINIVRKRGTKLDGSNPTLLYGYGGYGISETPVFLGAMRRLWLDGGGIYAVANIRGGAEYGERWHQEGMLTKKQNVFDDFAACAQYLIDHRYTAHDKLALMGGSNGGLLMGAEITQHPDLARAVVSAVGIYDMVRVELDPNGSFNTTEFGTVNNPDHFKSLYAYSPYHHVVKGAAYPAVLMLTGATDGRVNPMHSRKFTAALQAATSSGRPVLLRTNKTSGHGIGSSMDEQIEEQTDELTFLFDQLGVHQASSSTTAWTPPRTADGQPDLQGVWLNNSATPLERPRALEGRPFLTDEEVTELKQRATRLFNGGDSDFSGGDNFFLAVLANPDRYKNPNATGGAESMIEREFDHRTSLIVDPPDGRIPWTPEGKRRQDAGAAAGMAAPATGPEELTNAMRCTTYGVPRLGIANTNAAGPLGYYQIVQAPGYVVILLEAIHETRIIPLDGRPHLPGSVRQWSGDSRGRWEGHALVVESSNFSPEGNVMGSGEHLHVVERFTRTAPDTIDYEITLADRTTWTRPWTAVIHLKQSQAMLYEYACHEGNFEVMHDILAGARAAETAAQGAVKRPQ